MAERSASRTGIAPGVKLRGADKLRRGAATPLRWHSAAPARRPKPDWLRITLPQSPAVARVRAILRKRGLASVCEQAQCPNLGECFGKGAATFMILGEICTRRCSFCAVAGGIPLPPDESEPRALALAIAEMGLSYAVITSVDRDDLADGGAAHFAACIRETRAHNPGIRIEALVPDFRNRLPQALPTLRQTPPDVFNHNLETVPALYRRVRPGADYENSLRLLAEFRALCPKTPTKSGLMLGLGEEREQVYEVLCDLRRHGVAMITLGQYLQPGPHHLPVARFVPPEEFEEWRGIGAELGFEHVASGPLVRSSYHAEQQHEARSAPPASATDAGV